MKKKNGMNDTEKTKLCPLNTRGDDNFGTCRREQCQWWTIHALDSCDGHGDIGVSMCAIQAVVAELACIRHALRMTKNTFS